MNNIIFSSEKEDWETPETVFKYLDKQFHFTLDPCASKQNAKCAKFYTKDDDGLSKNWEGERVFCNPPYGKEIRKWVKKCHEESEKGTLVVLLVPARTDTAWFHDYIYKKHEISFIRGRLKFGGSKNNAPFPSMIVIMKNDKKVQEMKKNDK